MNTKIHFVRDPECVNKPDASAIGHFTSLMRSLTHVGYGDEAGGWGGLILYENTGGQAFVEIQIRVSGETEEVTWGGTNRQREEGLATRCRESQILSLTLGGL